MAIKSDFALAYNSRGVVLTLLNKTNEALIDFNKSSSIGPDIAAIHENLGAFWVRLKAPDGALAEFNKALSINNGFALAYHGRVAAFIGTGRYLKASHDFNQFISLSTHPILTDNNDQSRDALKDSIIIHTSGFGINQWPLAPNSLYPELCKGKKGFCSARINIIMPTLEEIKSKSTSDLNKQIAGTIIRRLETGMTIGTTVFELQIVQNMNTFTYPLKEHQEMVKTFGTAFFSARQVAINYMRSNLNWRI